MKYYVLNGAKKYDNVQNEGKGWYRNWAVVLDLSSENGKKYVGYHSETYYWEGSGWEDNHHGPTYWSELPKDFYEKYHQVGGEECSEACEALWYKFKDDNEEKVEMENASTSVTKEVINDMKKRYENMPTTSLKEVMGWLIEDKEVVYRFINPGEVDEWLKVDPKHPILAEQYEYQLAEKIQETWSFRIPEYSIKASCREEARKKAFEMIMKDPSYIVVYPGEHDNVI